MQKMYVHEYNSFMMTCHLIGEQVVEQKDLKYAYL